MRRILWVLYGHGFFYWPYNGVPFASINYLIRLLLCHSLGISCNLFKITIVLVFIPIFFKYSYSSTGIEDWRFSFWFWRFLGCAVGDDMGRKNEIIWRHVSGTWRPLSTRSNLQKGHPRVVNRVTPLRQLSKGWCGFYVIVLKPFLLASAQG